MSAAILGIDPGTTRSAWVLLLGDVVLDHDLEPNERLMQRFIGKMGWSDDEDPDEIVIEKVASYGMPVGEEVFETVYWSGRFAEAARPLPVERITRKAIVTHLCGSAKAKDANVRRALIDLWGGDAAIRKGGPLHGIKADVWAALAVAVAYRDGVR